MQFTSFVVTVLFFKFIKLQIQVGQYSAVAKVIKVQLMYKKLAQNG